MPKKARSVNKVRDDFKRYERAFLTGQGEAELNEWENFFGLRILRLGRRPFAGALKPEELRERWRGLGREPFLWPEEIEGEEENEDE